jgi:hypothetical protein
MRRRDDWQASLWPRFSSVSVALAPYRRLALPHLLVPPAASAPAIPGSPPTPRGKSSTARWKGGS